jgi:hypothetical protein
VNPYILDGVEAYIREHPDRDLQTVVDEALEVWLQVATEQDRAMEEQYAAPDDRPKEEIAAWEAIREANARLILGRRPDA